MLRRLFTSIKKKHLLLATLLLSVGSLSVADGNLDLATPRSSSRPPSAKPRSINSRSLAPKAKSKVTNDPIRFTIQSSKQTVSAGEPIELTVTAELLDIPSSLMFFTEEASAFRIKVLLPAGFVSTGGTYRDYIGDKLSLKNKALVSYTIQGFFESTAPSMCFRLLRSGGQADQNSVFVEKTGLCVRGNAVKAHTASNALAAKAPVPESPNARLDDCSGLSIAATANPTSVGTGGEITLAASCQGCSTASYNSGQAVSFDGIDDQIDAGWSYPAIASNFTLEAWVKPTQPLSGNAFNERYAFFPVNPGNSSTTGVGIAVGTNGVHVYEHTDNYLNKQLDYSGGINDWTHIAVVYANNIPKLYINGQWIKDGTASGKTPKPVVALGGFNYGHYAGSLDEVRLWSVARTSTQVATSYQQTLGGSESNLAGYWRFEETGNTALNTVSNGQQGSLQNGTSRVVGVSGNSAATYTWTALQPNSSITYPNQASTPVTVPTTAGTYTYRVTLASGSCSLTYDVPVTVTGGSCSGVTLSAIANPTTVNVNGQATLIASCNGCGTSSGQALSFDGTDDQVTFSGADLMPSVGSNFTWEAWVRPTQPLSGNAFNERYALFPRHGGETGDAANNTGMGVAVGTNGIKVYEHTSGYLQAQLSYTGSISDWTHVAIVYTNNVPALFVNGQLTTTGTSSGKTPHPSLRLGGDSYGHYAGDIDEVRIWNTSRSGTEIAANYQQTPSGNTANLVQYWRFEESGNLAANQVGSGLSGTLQNGTARTSGPGTGSGGATGSYSWQALNGGSLATPNQATTQVTLPSTAGSYVYRVTLSSGTCSMTKDLTVSVTGNTTDCYVVKNKQSNQYWQATADNLVQHTTLVANATNQIWKLVPTGNNGYKIISTSGAGDKVMYVDAQTDGQQIRLGTYQADSRYQWQRDSQADGSYRLATGGRTMDQAAFGSGPALQLWGSSSDGAVAYRQFIFEAATCPNGNDLCTGIVLNTSKSADSVAPGEQLTLSASCANCSQASYTWQALQPNSVLSAPNQANTSVIVPSTPGNYMYQVTLTSGACSMTKTVSVMVVSAPSNGFATPTTRQFMFSLMNLGDPNYRLSDNSYPNDGHGTATPNFIGEWPGNSFLLNVAHNHFIPSATQAGRRTMYDNQRIAIKNSNRKYQVRFAIGRDRDPGTFDSKGIWSESVLARFQNETIAVNNNSCVPQLWRLRQYIQGGESDVQNPWHEVKDYITQLATYFKSDIENGYCYGITFTLNGRYEDGYIRGQSENNTGGLFSDYSAATIQDFKERNNNLTQGPPSPNENSNQMYVGEIGKLWYIYRHQEYSRFKHWVRDVIRRTIPNCPVGDDYGQNIGSNAAVDGVAFWTGSNSKGLSYESKYVKLNPGKWDNPYFMTDFLRANMQSGQLMMIEADQDWVTGNVDLNEIASNIGRYFERGVAALVFGQMVGENSFAAAKQMYQLCVNRGYTNQPIGTSVMLPSTGTTIPLSDVLKNQTSLNDPNGEPIRIDNIRGQIMRHWDLNGGGANQSLRYTIDNDMLP